MKNIKLSKWLIRLLIVGIILLGSFIPEVYENLLNGLVIVGCGSLGCGLLIVAFVFLLVITLIFGVVMIIDEETCCTDQTLCIIFMILIISAISLFVWLAQVDYDLTDEIEIFKKQQLIGTEYEQNEHYILGNVDIASNINTLQFDIEILETKKEKSGITYKVQFVQDDIEEQTSIWIEKSIFDETIGEGFNSITGDVHSLNLKIPFKIIFRKTDNGNNLLIYKQYLYLDLSRYLFLNEKPFTNAEIQNIKEKFLKASLEYRDGNERAFDVFLNMANTQVVKIGVSEITMKEFPSDTYMWNSKTAKKMFQEIKLQIEDAIVEVEPEEIIETSE